MPFEVLLHSGSSNSIKAKLDDILRELPFIFHTQILRYKVFVLFLESGKVDILAKDKAGYFFHTYRLNTLNMAMYLSRSTPLDSVATKDANSRSIDMSIVDIEGNNFLQAAYYSPHLVECILSFVSSNVLEGGESLYLNKQNNAGETILHILAKKSKVCCAELVKKLLSMGCNPGIYDNNEKYHFEYYSNETLRKYPDLLYRAEIYEKIVRCEAINKILDEIKAIIHRPENMQHVLASPNLRKIKYIVDTPDRKVPSNAKLNMIRHILQNTNIRDTSPTITIL